MKQKTLARVKYLARESKTRVLTKSELSELRNFIEDMPQSNKWLSVVKYLILAVLSFFVGSAFKML